MAFETYVMSYEECKSIRDKYELFGLPFFIYRYDKLNNFYVYLTFGADYEHPGQFYLVWDNQVCWIEAYPIENGNILSENPEKTFHAHIIIVPKGFNKDRELLVKLIEQAFTNFEAVFKDKQYIFKIIYNREKLMQTIKAI